MFDLAELKAEHFEGLIGCELPIVESSHALTIKAIHRLKSPSPRDEPFALTLEAPAGTRGEQGIYRLQHPQLGELAIFLVPIAPVDGRTHFEAVFN